MDTGKVVISVLAGVAVGALLGVLFAPDKGSETRKKIMRRGSDSVDDLNDKFDELVSNLSEKFDAARDEANELYEKGKRKAEDLKKDMKVQMS
jgi:gas vesicle protein